MRKLFGILILIVLSLSCASVPKPHVPLILKIAPEHKGIDPKLQPYYDEYVALAKERGIIFKNKVTMGFKDLDSENYIGVCHRNGFMHFREIDIDKGYWDHTTEQQRINEVFHELTHCLCTRDHDFAPGKFYPEVAVWKIFIDITNMCVSKEPEGFKDDGCPVTIMHPRILWQWCFNMYYDEYIKEMFDRCEPW
jgi:hypothetical protein